MFIDSFVQFIINDTSKSIVNFHFLCLCEAFTINYSIIAATMWTSIVCHNLYANTFEIEVKYYVYRLFGYGIPAVFSLMYYIYLCKSIIYKWLWNLLSDATNKLFL